MNLQHCVNRLDLGCARNIGSYCQWSLAINHFIWGHLSGRMIGSIVPPFFQGKPLHPLVLFF
jgi:hypothetical protein